MKIKFKNLFVPVEMLVQGSVVAIDDEFVEGVTSYYHIQSFVGLGFEQDTMDLKIIDASGVYEESSANLIWPYHR